MADLSFSIDTASSQSPLSAAPRNARLNLQTLGHAADGVRTPKFDVAALQVGIVHIGCGAFHRAHQALLTQRAIEAEGGSTPAPWGIAAISMRSDKTRQALLPQDGLYTVLERGGEETTAEIVGSLRSVVSAKSASGALSASIASPAVKIVTLTVTAAGYCLNSETGRLEAEDPTISSDLKGGSPRSAVGLLAQGLEAVKEAGRRPPVILACDNVPHNGRALRQAVVDFAGLKSDILADWIGREVQFPSSVVDRIVPTPNADDRADAARLVDLRDEATVSSEPFRQWVIEEFEGPRPLWETAGAEFVPDVTAWETSKIRLLNGTHLAMAYLGMLAGLRTVSDVMSDPWLAGYVKHFMFEEQIPTVPPAGHDLVAYGRQLLARWQNPAIEHELARIGRNSSDKIQPRLLEPLIDNIEHGRPTGAALLAVAAWICCMCCPASAKQPMEDALAPQLRLMGRQAAGKPDALAASVLTLESVFGPLCRIDGFQHRLARAIALLQRVGTREAVRRTCNVSQP